MLQSARLRCINSPNRHIVVGQTYEVVEILELPGHAMVRKPNGKWPIPGEWYFAMHPDEYFESPAGGIPSFSCGYYLEDIEFFGAIIPNSLFPTPPKMDFSENSSQQRERDRISDIIEGAHVSGLWWLTYYNVLPKACFPEALEKKFMLLGVDYRNLVEAGIKRSAAKAIQAVMRELGISSKSMPLVEDQLMEFWYRSWREAGPLTWKSPVRKK